MSSDLLTLGSVPAGVNPYALFAATLHAALYRPSPKYYALRLYLLFGLISVVVGLALGYIAVLFADGRGKAAGGGPGPGRSKNMWLFRVARKSNEAGYIVTNAKLQAAVWSVITGVIMLASLANLKSITLEQGPIDQFSGWRSFTTVPLLIQAWLVTWGSLQAFILTTTQTDKRLFSPWVVNGLFVGGGAFLLAGLVATAAINTLAGNTVWAEYLSLRDQLAEFSAGWSANQTLAEQLAPAAQLVPVLAHVTRSTNYSRDTSIASLAILMGVPFIIAVVNLGSILLARLVRKQLSFHIQQATTTVQQSMSQLGVTSAGSGLGISSVQGAVPTVITLNKSFDGDNGNLHTSTRDSSQSQSQSNSAGAFQPRKFSLAPAALLSGARASIDSAATHADALASAGTSKTRMSRTALRQLATRRGSGAEVERARQIQSLQKAEADLSTISAFIGALLAGVSGLCAFTFIEYYNGQLNNGPWGVYEVGQTGVYWVWGVSMLGGLGFLLHNAWSARHLSLTPPLPEFVAASAYGPGGAAGVRRASGLTNPNLSQAGNAHAAFGALAVPAEVQVPVGMGQTSSFGGYSMASRHDWEKVEDDKAEEEEERASVDSHGSKRSSTGGVQPGVARRQTITFEH